eukprot:COSAG01_NODE_1851_length_9062_cov_44.766819_8_plen_200_part_00
MSALFITVLQYCLMGDLWEGCDDGAGYVAHRHPLITRSYRRLGLLATRWAPCVWLAERLRFACLVMHSVTFSVWWMVLVPVIGTVLPIKHRARFVRTSTVVRPSQSTETQLGSGGLFDDGSAQAALNRSALLVHFHVINIVVAGADFCVWPRHLTPHDLFVAVAIAMAYLVFYLTCLDRRGFQLYIVRGLCCCCCCMHA